VVHRLLGAGGKAVPAVAAEFPEARLGSGIDRNALGRMVFRDGSALRRLEGILHPLVRLDQQRFVDRMARRRAPVVVLDIPLLFESGGAARCDAVIVVSAPAFLQRHRVLRRPGMTPAKLSAILAKQMPDQEKRRRADFVVSTGLGRRLTLRRLGEIVRLARYGKLGQHLDARSRSRYRNHRSRSR
jgi:dephospho-CoA kinase